jgi:hypothetical protein
MFLNKIFLISQNPTIMQVQHKQTHFVILERIPYNFNRLLVISELIDLELFIVIVFSIRHCYTMSIRLFNRYFIRCS